MLVLEHGPPALVGCEVQARSIADEEPPSLCLLVGDGVDKMPEVWLHTHQLLHGPVVGLSGVVCAVHHSILILPCQGQLLLDLIPQVVTEERLPGVQSSCCGSR